ncbi:MAG: DUF5107 domain-containing protein [Planctomycetota bacterium]|nr:DUF5107 domain-containing protein [Planctomycetota bacterium]
MTTLRTEDYTIPAATMSGENPLPVFRDVNESFVMPIDPKLPDDERRYVGWKAQYRVLPHRMQDHYDRVKKPRAFKAVVLENEILRATFLPELGGRLVSLFNKPRGLELLDRNPVWQPANLALRNAWFSGGVEWNTSCFGHYHLTCSPVFAARVEGLNGEPALRLYEFDRTKAFPWQIDFHLPEGSAFLFVRVRLINTHDYEIPMYWWSNIAAPESPDTRVLVPADTALHHTGDAPLEVNRLPLVFGKDAMYVTNVPMVREFYFRLEKNNRPWVAALKGDGRGLVQTSTSRLQGRKLFCWGMASGGRNWQEYLAAPGRAYLEIQAGLGKVQPTCLPMPGHAQWAWTEAYGMLEADPKKVHAPEWSQAWRAAQADLDAALPEAKLNTLHDEFGRVAVRPVKELLAKGSGWGALERRRLKANAEADRIPAELAFPDDALGPDQQAWVALLDQGALPERSPQDGDPGPFQTQDEWRWLLERHLAEGRGAHWLAHYHHGVMLMEAHDSHGARKAWEKSHELKPNAWALRNLAQLELRRGKKDKALERYQQAWKLGPQVAALAVEYAKALSDAERFDELRVFCAELPEALRGHERIRIASALAALKTGRLDEIEPLFAYPFATIREGEVTLTDIWFEWHANRLAMAAGKPVDEAFRTRAKKECPPPANIDFRLLVDIH